MKEVIALAALLGLAASAAAETPFTILDSEAARALGRGLCSRAVSPTPIQDYWRPSDAQVAEVEALLPSAAGIPLRAFDPESYRQYAGLVVAGRRLIYVNFFPRARLEMRDEIRAQAPSKEMPPRDAWRRHLADVCDGGTRHWGILFDPAQRTFFFPQFNGAA